MLFNIIVDYWGVKMYYNDLSQQGQDRSVKAI